MSPDGLWVIILSVLALLTLTAVWLPLRLRLRFQGRGEPNGVWALAGALQVGPVIGSGVAAQGIDATLRVQVFGRQLYERTLADFFSRKEPEPEAEPESLATRVERAIDRIASLHRRLPAENVLGFLVRERRRIRIDQLELDLDYSFADVALTGKLLGAIYAVSALLPPQIVIRQNPRWEFEDCGQIAASGSVTFWPGLLFVDALVFLVRNMKTLVFAKRAPEAT